MASDEGSPSQGNDTRVEQTNGSTRSSFLRTALSGATNGTRKAGLVVNGSSNGDKVGNGVTPPQPTSYFGHDREEVTRILIQSLSDMGYQDAAESVSRDSGFSLESPTVASFRSAVLRGAWAEAEQLLAGATVQESGGGGGNGLVLATGSDPNIMRFWLRQQKYLELLEKRDTPQALMVLRSELTPLYQDTQKLHFLSGLLMSQSTEDLKAKADWDGANGQSRRLLLSELSKCISPSVMLPEHRLAVLLEQVKRAQIDAHFPTEVALELNERCGEIWQVQFSHDGTKLAACGSEGTVVVWETRNFSVAYTLRDHDGGVGNVSWSPDDSLVVTCAQDKSPRLWDGKTGALRKKLRRFDEPISGCVWAANGRSFVIGALDRQHSIVTFNVDDDEEVDWNKRHRVQDMCGSPDGRWLVAVDDVQTIHVYDGTTHQFEYDMELKVRPTSVNISQDSRHLLVNRRDGELQLIDLVTRTPVQKFLGHTGGDYMIRSAFGGANESFVLSGSEDGNVVIWHKNSGAAVERLLGHLPRCNAVSWNPTDPCMIASCGDDGRVKIWSNKAKAAELKARHASKGSNGWSVTSEGA